MTKRIGRPSLGFRMRSLRLPADLWDAIDAAADAAEESTAAFLRRVLPRVPAVKRAKERR